jgi:hypothetical protein
MALSSREKQAAFNKHGIDLPPLIKDEASFRLCFENLGRGFKEKHYTNSLIQLQFGPINSSVSAADTLERFIPPFSPAALTSAAVHVAIKVRQPDSVLYVYVLKLTETLQTACDAGVKLFGIVELLDELHSAVPQVGASLYQFPHDVSLHIPLYSKERGKHSI